MNNGRSDRMRIDCSLMILVLFVFVFSSCAASNKKYYKLYPSVSEDAKIVLDLNSNIQKTAFFIDGKEMAIGRRVKVLIDNKPHTVIASPEGYREKEEYLQPPYNSPALLSFTFLIEDKLPSLELYNQEVSVPNIHGNTLGSSQTIYPKLDSQYAVIIGISRYKYSNHNDLTNLLFADNDAKAFSNMLYQIGWQNSNVKLLLNEQATLRNIKIAIDSWLTKAGPNDLIVLFWSGHGYPDPEDPTKVYFACYDTEITIPATGYRMDDVRRSLEERKSKNVIIFADTCHAGKLITRGSKGISIIPQIDQIKESKNIPNGWIFMVGADSDREAIEHSSWSNGAFTHCLIEAISGNADGYLSAGAKDNIVTMGELRAYLNNEMPGKTQKVLGVAKRPVIITNAGDPGIWNLTLYAK